MKRIALSLAAFALFGAVAFADDAAAPVAKFTGYLGTGAILSGSGNQDTQIQPKDRNNGGPVDFRLNLDVATATDGLQFSLWNSTGSVTTTNLQYAYAWASFFDKQLTTKVGLQDDNTTGSENEGYGSNDNGNTTNTNNAVSAKLGAPTTTYNQTNTTFALFSNTSNNTPAFDAVYAPSAVPGLALDYYLPFGWSSVYAPDAFGLSRLGGAYAVNGFGKIVVNYEFDQTCGTSTTNGPIPTLNFGLTFTQIQNLKVRVEGSYVTNSNAVAASQLIQDIGYTVKLSDTDSVTPYFFIREYLNANGINASTTNPSGAYTGVAAKNTGSFVDLELMPQISYTSGAVTYAVDVDIYHTGANLLSNAVATTYAVQPNVTCTLPGSQQIEVAGSVGTLGSDATDGNGAGQNYGTYFNSNLGQVVGWDVWLNYKYSF